jgi:hypothetical protein
VGAAHLPRIAAINMDQRLGNTIEEGLSPDKSVIGEQIGPEGQMLAAAKADLEMERAIIAEQSHGGNRSFRRHGDPGQQIIDQPLLSCTQWLAL